jgi:hypothetical protein
MNGPGMDCRLWVVRTVMAIPSKLIALGRCTDGEGRLISAEGCRLNWGDEQETPVELVGSLGCPSDERDRR